MWLDSRGMTIEGTLKTTEEDCRSQRVPIARVSPGSVPVPGSGKVVKIANIHDKSFRDGDFDADVFGKLCNGAQNAREFRGRPELHFPQCKQSVGLPLVPPAFPQETACTHRMWEGRRQSRDVRIKLQRSRGEAVLHVEQNAENAIAAFGSCGEFVRRKGHRVPGWAM